jgi:glycosyltransferase involved in cell wall biosynthesis
VREVLFDISRLLVRGSRFTPTGIDRVVLAYARWLLAEPEVSLQPVATVGGRILACPRDLLARIVDGAEAFSAAARANPAADRAWTQLTQALRDPSGRTAPSRSRSVAAQLAPRALWHASVLGRDGWRLRPARLTRDAIYLNVSHTGLDHPQVLGRVAAAGAAPVVMVHDLIPITHPEYCSPSAEARHVRRMAHVLRHARLVIANSATTADVLARYAVAQDETPPPAVVAPLGLEADFLSPPPALAGARPYFVALGTLEARKNLASLLALWRRLAERMGEAAPSLVLVGRRGWENEAVIDHLERSKSALRLVHEIADLQDIQVASLLAGARALLAPSFAEGYDLPVIEALSVGTPVIASDIPVHRELARGAQLIDPLDGPAWLAAIEAASLSPIRPPPSAGPRWTQHFASVRDAVLAAR